MKVPRNDIEYRLLAMPLIRRVFPELIASDIVSVQPMTKFESGIDENGIPVDAINGVPVKPSPIFKMYSLCSGEWRNDDNIDA